MDELKQILRNNVREKISAGEVASSMTVRLVRHVEIARLARTAGFDSFYVDMEHSSFDFDTTGQICMMGLEVGITPMVRVPANTPEYISRVLDGGALGIIAPDVRSAAEARQVVAAAKYPPLGGRGLSGSLPHLQFRSFPTASVLAALNAATLVIVQFESAEAVACADEIAAVDGVDMVLIGTNDLMADLGIPGQFDNVKVREAYSATIEACRRHGKHVGVGGLSSRPDLVADFVRQGARYVSTGTDLAFLLGAAAQKARQVRDLAVLEPAL